MLSPEKSINLLNSGNYVKMAQRQQICEMIQGLLQQLVAARDELAAEKVKSAEEGDRLCDAIENLARVRRELEQAEAQCAFLIEAYCGECDYDSEICRGTRPDMKCAVREMDGTAGSALLAELQRYREAALSASSSAPRVTAGEQGAPFDEYCPSPDKEVKP